MSEEQQHYFLIQDKTTILSGPGPLPNNYGIISGIDSYEIINPEMLKDLKFAGMPGTGFWKAIYTEKPEYTIKQDIEQVYDIDPVNCTVTIAFKVTKLPAGGLAERRLSLWGQVRSIRDNYLRLTDFSQLPDSPLSPESKEAYKIFRVELRDLVQADSAIDPNTISWPNLPAGGSSKLPPFPAVPNYK